MIRYAFLLIVLHYLYDQVIFQSVQYYDLMGVGQVVYLPQDDPVPVQVREWVLELDNL